MKKSILILLLILTALLAAGCASGGTGAAAKPALDKTVPLAQKVEAIAADAKDLSPLDADDLSDALGIEPEDYSEFVYLQDNGLGGREILVIRAANQDAAARVAKQMENYLEMRRKETRNYLPEAYQLLAQAKVETKGLTAALISGAGAAEETKAMLAGE